MINFINPQSEVKLLNVNIKNDYKHQYTFSNITEQTNFFLSKATGKNFSKCTFVKDGEITVEGHIYENYNANYLMFRNTGFSDKWFYAFITSIDYVNENACTIHYELDCFQTWYFDIHYKQSFIVREHVASDNIGEHTVDEGLGYGDYVFFDAPTSIQNLNDFYYVMAVTQSIPDSADDNDFVRGGLYDGIFSGLKYYATGNWELMADALLKYNQYGKGDAVQYIACIPKFCMPDFQDVSGEAGQPVQVLPGQFGARVRRTYEFDQNTIDGYTPKNKKVFCSPYNVIELTDNKGQTAVLKPELFSEFGKCNFEIMSNMSGNVSVACFPSNYAKVYTDTDEAYFSADPGITIGNFPQCAWTSSFYLNWLAQNSYGNNIQLGIGIGNGLLSMGVGMATGNPISTTIGLSSIAGTIGNYLSVEHKAEVTPNQAKGNSSNIRILYKS